MKFYELFLSSLLSSHAYLTPKKKEEEDEEEGFSIGAQKNIPK